MNKQNPYLSLVVLILFNIVWITSCTSPSNNSTPTVVARDSFEYRVHITDKSTGEPIFKADVDITTPGISSPFRSTTDSAGVTVFSIPNSQIGKTGRVTVDYEEYVQYVLNVFLNDDAPMEEIKLTSEDVASTTGSSILPIPISTPTFIPQPTDQLASTPKKDLPTFTCVFFSYGSYFTLLQIIEDGLDEQNGFHLETVAWDLLGLDGNGAIPYEEITERMHNGQWDCLLDTLDGLALDGNYGAITAIISESVGSDQIWVKPEIKTVNDIFGKRVVYFTESVGEFMLYALLELVGYTPNDIILIPATSMDEAVEIFNRGDADVVIGWEPNILAAQQGGGSLLLDSKDFRYLVDIITISQQAIADKPEIVQAFHKAWFEALKMQSEDLPSSSLSIADWGNNDWTYVYPDTAVEDMHLWLASIAQASYGANLIIMQNPDILHERLTHSRAIWENANATVESLDIMRAVDPQFVLNLQNDPSIRTNSAPYNSSFSMAGLPPLPTIPPEVLTLIAGLPCDKFEFAGGETSLTQTSQQILDECVVHTLRASPSLYLRIIGSAAWPANGGYTEGGISNFGKQRGIVIAQYLANNGIDPARLIIKDGLVPPPERQNVTDPLLLEMDRFVILELMRNEQLP